MSGEMVELELVVVVSWFCVVEGFVSVDGQLQLAAFLDG